MGEDFEICKIYLFLNFSETMKLLKFFVGISLVAASDGYQERQIEKYLERNVKKVTRNVGWDLLFAAGESNQNKVISPLSIIGAMYMLAAGSKGDTQSEILTKLTGMEMHQSELYKPEDMFNGYYNLRYFLSHDENAYQLDIANGIFAKEGLLTTDFETEVGKYMFNDVENVQAVDFENDPEAATQKINDWIKSQTNGMIDPMYQETLDSQLALIMVSSLYFKSSWDNKFTLITKKSSQEEQYAACWPKSFEATSECDERVQFMTAEGDFSVVTVNSNDGKAAMEVIEIPLEGDDRAFTYNGEKYGNKMQFQIWIPKEEDIRDPVVDKKFQETIKTFAHRQAGDYRARKVKLTMPKFSIDFSEDMKELMKNIGIETVFSQEKDLTPMVGEQNSNVEISKINHKVKFDVDENGIEGAAVTAVEISFRTISTPKPIVITRPFYFTVSSKCWNMNSKQKDHKGCPYGNVPVFVGKVVNPAE